MLYLKALKWDEKAHPRKPAGSAAGGEFAPQGGTAIRSVDTRSSPSTEKFYSPSEYTDKEYADRSAKTRGGSMRTSAVDKERLRQASIEDDDDVAVDAARGKLSPAQQAMQAELARLDKQPVHQVQTAEEGVALILKGQNVELKDTKDVHTVLQRLGEMAIEAEKAKQKAPSFDPCRITVKGTSLFCSEKIKTKEFPNGLPRIEMPQFKSKNPTPGSEADKLPRSDKGEVDASKAFLQHLEKVGVKTDPNGQMLARKLKASQAEMGGTTVAGMMLNEKFDPKSQKIWVSRDGYVIDGHHTWAAAVGRDAKDGNLDNDKMMDVVVVDLPMSEVYHLAKSWTTKYGLPAAAVKKYDLQSIAARGRVSKSKVPHLVVKSDDQQLIFGEVYAPNRPDAQGEYMTAHEIQKMAHAFVRSGRMGQIDLMHGNKVVKGASVVESFVAEPDDNRFISGSWVVGVHVPDAALWAQIKKGDINGFSMEALVTRHDMDVEIEVPPVVTGLTSKQENHQHKFFVSYDEHGQFKGGVTDTVNGHHHLIVAGTHTQDSQGHRHRFSSVDDVRIL